MHSYSGRNWRQFSCGFFLGREKFFPIWGGFSFSWISNQAWWQTHILREKSGEKRTPTILPTLSPNMTFLSPPKMPLLQLFSSTSWVLFSLWWAIDAFANLENEISLPSLPPRSGSSMPPFFHLKNLRKLSDVWAKRLARELGCCGYWHSRRQNSSRFLASLGRSTTIKKRKRRKKPVGKKQKRRRAQKMCVCVCVTGLGWQSTFTLAHNAITKQKEREKRDSPEINLVFRNILNPIKINNNNISAISPWLSFFHRKWLVPPLHCVLGTTPQVY